MDDGDQKLEVIRKLLAKAEGAATPDEADAYNDKAAKLMARHGVDSAMLAATDGGTRDVIESRRIAMTNPYSTEKASLVGCIARATGCRTVRHLGSGRGQTSAVTVMGFRSDLDRVEMLFTSLLLQATKSVVHQRPATPSESTAAFRRTWLLGFASEVYLRLADAEKAAAQRHDGTADPSGPSAALVLADRRSLVDRAFDEQFNDLVPGRTRRLSGSGYKAGMEAGRRADVGQTRVGGSTRELDR